jgi:predicted  nucleic acid-binding Zn-ribbon protein
LTVKINLKNFKIIYFLQDPKDIELLKNNVEANHKAINLLSDIMDELRKENAEIKEENDFLKKKVADLECSTFRPREEIRANIAINVTGNNVTTTRARLQR